MVEVILQTTRTVLEVTNSATAVASYCFSDLEESFTSQMHVQDLTYWED